MLVGPGAIPCAYTSQGQEGWFVLWLSHNHHPALIFQLDPDIKYLSLSPQLGQVLGLFIWLVFWDFMFFVVWFGLVWFCSLQIRRMFCILLFGFMCYQRSLDVHLLWIKISTLHELSSRASPWRSGKLTSL